LRIGWVTIGWDSDGRIRKTVSASAVREQPPEAQKKIDSGLLVGDDKRTVISLLDHWFTRDVMRDQVASPALSNYETSANLHIRPALG
jgi:hypothetical protein